jgi:hypothetical protein
MADSSPFGPCERLETFDGWLQRYKVKTRRFIIPGDEIDRLYSLYLADWSTDAAAALSEDGLQPIGLPLARVMDRIQVAYDARQATPADIEAMLDVPPGRSWVVDITLFVCGLAFGAAAAVSTFDAVMHAGLR